MRYVSVYSVIKCVYSHSPLASYDLWYWWVELRWNFGGTGVLRQCAAEQRYDERRKATRRSEDTAERSEALRREPEHLCAQRSGAAERSEALRREAEQLSTAKHRDAKRRC